MAKQIMQFRYYKDGHPNNWPEKLVSSQLLFPENGNGGAFSDIASITQLGIQTLPGTRFHLNNNNSPDTAVIIGSTGIYELDLEGISTITDLWFEAASLKAVSDNPNAYLIIDMICELRQED